MHFYVDESGNTGLELFDKNQPVLYYGVLRSHTDLDVVASPLLNELRGELGVARIHANELGVGRLTPIADRLARFSKKHDLQFSLLKVAKPDHAVITFFDQVFDSGLNKAVSWHHYFTPLRYPLLFKVAYLFDEKMAKAAWKARREMNPARAAEMLVKLCNDLLERVDHLPDARSRELVSGALKWAAANPFEISYGVGNHDTALQISPNLIGFQQVLHTIAVQSANRRRKVRKITVDRQNEFNGAQGELADWYDKLRGHKADMGPGMPSFDYSWMPEVPPTFTPGDASGGLEIVDVILWIAKRMQEEKPLSPELENLFWTQARLGKTDQVSLAGIDERWRFLLALPEAPISEEMHAHFERLEAERKRVKAAL